MKEFQGLHEFDEYLKKIIAKEKMRKLAILDAAGQLIEDLAKRKFGEYQQEVGPFVAWEPLANATIDDRVRKGFTPNDPLLRTGELRDSIYHGIWEAMADTVFIGSDSDIMVWQELGTPGSPHPIPPRAVLGPAAFESKIEILKLIAEGISAWIMDKSTFVSKPGIKK